jgi:ribosomal protein L2
MALKTFKPTSPGQRQLVTVDRSGLHKGGPVKALTEGLSKSGGRNNAGRMTSRNGRRSQADLPHHRLQARQEGCRSDGRAPGIRSEPHRVHRASEV